MSLRYTYLRLSIIRHDSLCSVQIEILYANCMLLLTAVLIAKISFDSLLKYYCYNVTTNYCYVILIKSIFCFFIYTSVVVDCLLFDLRVDIRTLRV